MKNVIHDKNSRIWWYKDLFQIYIDDKWKIYYGYEDTHEPGTFDHLLQIGKICIAW